MISNDILISKKVLRVKRYWASRKEATLFILPWMDRIYRIKKRPEIKHEAHKVNNRKFTKLLTYA